MLRLFFLTVFLGAIPAIAGAQAPATMYQDMQAAMQAAQAGANRPGDETLNCEALAGELVANVKQPAVQSYVARSGADAQARLNAMNGASGQMATQAALTVFSSLVPGGAWAGHAAGVARAEAQRADAARNIQQRMQQAQEMMTIMPQLTRGNRVIELATARDCAWLKGSMPR